MIDQNLLRLIYEMQQQLMWQTSKLNEIQGELRMLRDETESLKGQKQSGIEKIDYHFDQLKVEKLEGTLNIGLTPYTSGQIGQLSANGNHLEDIAIQQVPPEPYAYTPEHQWIYNQVHQFLRSECPEEIRKLEEDHMTILGQDYRTKMIEDVARQVNERIRFYLELNNQNEVKMEGRELEKWVVDKMKGDIQQALRNHFEQLNNKKGDTQ